MKFNKDEIKKYVNDFYARNPNAQKPKDIQEKVFEYYDYVRNEEKVLSKPDFAKEQFIDATISDILNGYDVETYAKTSQDVIHFNYYDYFLYEGAGDDLYNTLKENKIPSVVLAGIKKHESSDYTYELGNGEQITVNQIVDNRGDYKYVSYFKITKIKNDGTEEDVFEYGSDEEAEKRQERFQEYIDSIHGEEFYSSYSKRERKEAIRDFNLFNQEILKEEQRQKKIIKKGKYLDIKVDNAYYYMWEGVDNYVREQQSFTIKFEDSRGRIRYRNAKTGRFVKGDF